MVGGRVIENAQMHDGSRRLWVVDRHRDECAVHVLNTAVSRSICCGEEIWWQSGRVFARNDGLAMAKIGNSYDPRSPE